MALRPAVVPMFVRTPTDTVMPAMVAHSDGVITYLPTCLKSVHTVGSHQ
jgi:hypothetical protein